MTEQCENLATCGFFKKYQGSKDLVCKGFVQMFCQGAKMNECKRKAYRKEHGAPPPDNMMPNGTTLPD